MSEQTTERAPRDSPLENTMSVSSHMSAFVSVATISPTSPSRYATSAW